MQGLLRKGMSCLALGFLGCQSAHQLSPPLQNTLPETPGLQTSSADNHKTMDSTTLIYVYDALCGWCYGFSPVMQDLSQQHPELQIQVVSGGMIRGDREGTIAEVAPYIKKAYRDVEQRTGVRFGEAFLKGPLEEGSMYMSSLQPAVLLSYIKARFAEKQLKAAHELQQGIYYHGLGPNTEGLVDHLAQSLNLDSEELRAASRNPEYLQAAERDFELSQKLGVQGFPTVFARKGGQIYRLSSGYVDAAHMEALLHQLSQIQDSTHTHSR